MDLETRLLTLPRIKQLEVTQRIFQRFALAFGRRSADMWQGMEMADVYEDWADSLQGCSLGAIQHGIELAKLEPGSNPPTQGQFVAFCRKYEPVPNVHQLENRLTPEQLEKNKRRIAEIAAGLAAKKAPSEEILTKVRVG